MDSTQGLLLTILWAFARFGIPILVTVVIFALLSRYDSRWKQEALAKRKQEAAQGLIPLVKCWVFNDCPPEKRESCPAYQEKYLPCWQVFRDEDDLLQRACLTCPVFKKAPIPIVDRY